MKKRLIIICILLGTIGISNAEFQDSLYCKIHDDSISVSLSSIEAEKCTVYIELLNTILLKEIKKLSNILILIQQGKDVYFWKSLYDSKSQKVGQIYRLKTKIEIASRNFEISIFAKLKVYIVYKLQEDIQLYEKKMSNIKTLSYYNFTDSQKTLIDNIEGDIQKIFNEIDQIEGAKTLDQFMKHTNNYFYLKRLFIGKWG